MTFQAAQPSFQPFQTTAVLPQMHVMGHRVTHGAMAPVVASLIGPGRRCIAFLNAHCANIAVKDVQYRAALARADMLLPDGIGVELAAKMDGKEIVENLNGTDLAPELMRRAADTGLSVFLFGGTPGTAATAAKAIAAQVPGLKIAGTRDGYDGKAGAVEAINASGADILLVAMGVPMQELWLDRHFNALRPRICLSVGGLLDFWAGNVKRAPKLVRRMKSEWVWRLLMEPRRMAKRYLIGNLTFMARAAAHAVRQRDASALPKRLLDIGLSLGALITLSPMWLMILLAIRLESKGAPVFTQTRVGRSGKAFTIYKFRSMAQDSEAQRAALLNSSDRDGICFKAKKDPRVTRIGRVLRRYSLDELPQILNVLKGDMSIVGPRPALPEEVAAYPNRALGRLDVKPGLTGLWQVSGRADIGFDQMIEMDLAYAKSRSVLLDLILIWLTFRAVLSGRGAY